MRGSRFISRWRRCWLYKRDSTPDGIRCRYCKRFVSPRQKPGPNNLYAATIDHMRPKGGHGVENLVTSCWSCNVKKGAAVGWKRQRRGRLRTWVAGEHPPPPAAMEVAALRAELYPGQV